MHDRGAIVGRVNDNAQLAGGGEDVEDVLSDIGIGVPVGRLEGSAVIQGFERRAGCGSVGGVQCRLIVSVGSKGTARRRYRSVSRPSVCFGIIVIDRGDAKKGREAQES